MSAEENEAVFRRWIEAYNERDRQGEADARALGYVAHAPGVPEPLDSGAWEEFIFDVFVGAFPDLRLTIEEIGCGDDTVAARMGFRGTHRAEFQGLPPTNGEVAFRSVELNPHGRRQGGGALVRVRPGQAVRAVGPGRHTRPPAVAAPPRSQSEEAVARDALGTEPSGSSPLPSRETGCAGPLHAHRSPLPLWTSSGSEGDFRSAPSSSDHSGPLGTSSSSVASMSHVADRAAALGDPSACPRAAFLGHLPCVGVGDCSQRPTVPTTAQARAVNSNGPSLTPRRRR